MRRGDIVRHSTPASHISVCMCRRMWREDRNNPSVSWVTAPRSQNWWLYVNRACADHTSVHQVVKKAFIKKTQPYQRGAGRFSGWRAAAISGPFSSTGFIFFSVSRVLSFSSWSFQFEDFWALGVTVQVLPLHHTPPVKILKASKMANIYRKK